MSISRQEEVIACLWAIMAILCYSQEWNVAGTIFAVKAAADTATSIAYAWREAIAEIKNKTNGKVQ